MPVRDLTDAVAVTRDIYWVGFSETTRLRCNPYLLLDGDEAVLLDPGSIPDFPSVMRKVVDVVNPAAISHVVVSHQDPDVCGNLAVVEDVIQRDDLRIVGHTNTIRLVRHLGLKSEFYDVTEHGEELTLRSGRRLRFVWVPFLHSPGAIVTWDERTGTLFSGDLFGGIGSDDGLFAGRAFPESMRTFHQAYMPSNTLLRPALRRLRTLPIQRILPQHGSVIEGDQVAEAFVYLENLPCGIDLLGA